MKVVKKPWGNFKEFVLNKKCSVKILSVEPFGALSLQYHHYRDEMCYFLTSGYIRLGKKIRAVKRGDIVNIKREQLHRIFAKKKKVEYLEISFGKFDENDIVRIEDKYGRVR